MAQKEVTRKRVLPRKRIVTVAPGNESNFLFMRAPNNVLFISANVKPEANTLISNGTVSGS